MCTQTCMHMYIYIDNCEIDSVCERETEIERERERSLGDMQIVTNSTSSMTKNTHLQYSTKCRRDVHYRSGQ